MTRGRLLLVLGLLAALAVAGGGAWWAVVRYLDTPGPLAGETVVYVPRGSGVEAITRRLAEAGAIDRPWLFRIALRLSGRDRRLQAGEYRLTARMTPAQILDMMQRGDVLLRRITVPEGLTVAEVYALLAEVPFLTGALPEPPPPEGRLLPETYLFPRDAPRRVVVRRMRAALEEALADAWAQRAPDLPLASPEEALVLASLIEKETSLPEEYPIVAAVFVNRLRKGMRLQSDPTVIYALTGGKTRLGRRLTRADLAIDSPYNTYRRAGLPPTPIANPGRRALMAAVRPADVDYLYFVADGTGGHAFSRTLAEHNRKVRAWRRIRDRAGGRVPLPVPRPAAGGQPVDGAEEGGVEPDGAR